MLKQLERLERELHSPSARADFQRITDLLHVDFREFNRNGCDYTLADILDELAHEGGSLHVWSGDYALQYLTAESALLLYKSAHIELDGSISSFSMRSSLWVRDGERWKMLFHQGTPAEAFEIR